MEARQLNLGGKVQLRNRVAQLRRQGGSYGGDVAQYGDHVAEFWR
jgi:hypothetical protein